MIQLCGKAIVEPLQIVFLPFLEEGVYPDDWKKSNVVPIHKKESKDLIKNYRSISLLPVFSKVFERIIFNSLFNQVFYRVILVSHNSFPLHEIYEYFDCNPSVDVRITF